jgi:hypothetical protein
MLVRYKEPRPSIRKTQRILGCLNHRAKQSSSIENPGGSKKAVKIVGRRSDWDMESLEKAQKKPA